MASRKWTEEQRAEQARKVHQHWQTHRHPNLDTTHSEATKARMRRPKQKSPQKGNCIICGRALYNVESSKRGMGPKCAGLEH